VNVGRFSIVVSFFECATDPLELRTDHPYEQQSRETVVVRLAKLEAIDRYR